MGPSVQYGRCCCYEAAGSSGACAGWEPRWPLARVRGAAVCSAVHRTALSLVGRQGRAHSGASAPQRGGGAC